MTKKNIIIIAILIIVSVVMALLYYFIFFKPELVSVVGLVNTNSTIPNIEPDNNFDPAQCDEYQNDLIKNACLKIKNLKILADLIQDCQDYTNDQELTARCVDNGSAYEFDKVLMAEAVKSAEINKCLAVTLISSRNQCLNSIAVNTHDVAVCQKISEPQEQIQCQILVISVDNDFEQCGKLSDEDSVLSCQKMIIDNKNNNLEFCEQLTNKESREKCLELSYTRAAIINENYSLCDKITVAGGKSRCLAQLPPDTDGDGLSDNLEEYRFRTNFNKVDTDGDGLTDYQEVKTYQTNPLNPDTDGDGISDGEEVAKSLDPLNF